MKQECISVGCVPPASVAITRCQFHGVYLPRVYLPGVYLLGVYQTYPLQKEPGTRHTHHPRRDLGQAYIPPHVDRHTPVKTLTCPKLRLRAVVKYCEGFTKVALIHVRETRSSLRSLLLPPTMNLGQGNVFIGICDSVHRGFCLSACWDTTRLGADPLGPGTPLKQTRPGTRHPLQE